MKSTDAGLLDITEAEASVDCWAAVPHLVGVEVDPDGEGPDEAVDVAVCGLRPVGRVVCDGAEDGATNPLDAVLWLAARRLLAAAGRAGGGAGDGDPVLGAGQVSHHGSSSGGGDGETLGVLTGGVADPTETSLVSHTDRVLLIGQLEALALL